MSTASSRFFPPTPPPLKIPPPEKKHTDPSRMPQPAPIKAVTQCHICNNNGTPRNGVFRRLDMGGEQMGPPQPRSAPLPPRRCTSHHRFKGVCTAASANRGGGERRPHAGATRPVSPQARVKRKRSHAAFPHLHICGGGVGGLTYGGAYVKLSSATSLIANHRVQTRLTPPPTLPPQPPLTRILFSPFLNTFLLKKKKRWVWVESSIKGQKC